MYYFKINENRTLIPIKEKPFRLEKELQLLCEENLEVLFGLKFVKSEFSIGQFRIDTLAFDESTNAFVIIEYKNRPSYSVIDQGMSYLSVMLNNKAEFVLEYNENNGDSLRKESVDWSQSRVIFISPSFSTYQKEAINFKDLPIELWEVKKYTNNTINFNPIMSDHRSTVKESIHVLGKKNNSFEQVAKEIKVYTEEDHFTNIPDDILELYYTFKESILSIDHRFMIRPTKVYIGFIIDKRNIIDIALQKSALKIWVNAKQGELVDYKGITKDVSNIGHHGNGEYEVKVTDTKYLEYILNFVKEVIKIQGLM